MVWVVIGFVALVSAVSAARYGERRRRAQAMELRAAEAAARERRARLPAEFAHFREQLEFVRERLYTFLGDPCTEPGVDLDDWPRHADDFARVLGIDSEEYRALGAAYRGVTAVGHGLDAERAEPVLQALDLALDAVERALHRLDSA